jgi:N-acetylneuraminate synthase
MHGRSEIANSVARLEQKEAEGLLLLHCVSAYPTPLDHINVTSVRTLSTVFGTLVGFSDHTMDPVTAPTAAVANGAAVVEKHFTLDRTMEGPDHKFALEPNEFNQMVDAIRRTESALGDGCLDVTEIESNSIDRAKRRIYAAKRLEKGKKLTEDAVRLLRPGYSDDDDALAAGHYDDIIGATVARTLKPGEPISLRDIKS